MLMHLVATLAFYGTLQEKGAFVNGCWGALCREKETFEHLQRTVVEVC